MEMALEGGMPLLGRELESGIWTLGKWTGQTGLRVGVPAAVYPSLLRRQKG